MIGMIEIILLMVVVAAVAAAAAVWLSAGYWRRRIREHEECANLKAMNMRFGIDRELRAEQQRLSEREFEHKKELLANDQLARKAQNKVDMVYNVLHDVQAVHQGADSYLRLLINGSNTMLVRDEWEFMCRELSKKSTLLRDLVDCSIEVLQYENIADVPRNDEVLVNQFCQDMFEACERYLKNDEIDLSVETTLPDDYTARTNMGYLKKLIKNLIICSMEYTKSGFIKMLVVEEKKRGMLRFILNDTGPGIPAEIRKHVFDRLPNDADLKNKIVGVRLRICRVLAHLLGGSIYVDPFYTGGTSMVFTVGVK